MTIGGQEYTNFRAVNLRGTVQLRFQADNAGGTLRADLSEGLDRAYQLPNKSGTFPISGTFRVQLPAIAATTFIQSTIATVSGIRAEDGLTVTPQGGVSAGYGTPTTARIFYSATPGNGNIAVNFFNIGAATGYVDLIMAYTAVR